MPLSKSIPTAMPHIPPVMTLVTNTFNPMDLWISTSIVSRMKDATANKTRYLVLTSLMDIITFIMWLLYLYVKGRHERFSRQIAEEL